jgi:hypothetical protein
LQNLEAKFYPETICTRHIHYIVRYVDDIFIVYDETQTTAQDILMAHNRMHPSMKYNVEIEQDGMISFLDLKIHRHGNEISIGTYRKPTFTDVIIPSYSNHPKQHKTSSLKYMLDRANKLPLSKEEHARELSIINTIATNNGYYIKTIMKTYNRCKNKCNRAQYSQNKEKKRYGQTLPTLEMKLEF